MHIVLTIMEGSGNRPRGGAGTIPPTYFRDVGRSENLERLKIHLIRQVHGLEHVLLLILPKFVRAQCVESTDYAPDG